MDMNHKSYNVDVDKSMLHSGIDKKITSTTTTKMTCNIDNDFTLTNIVNLYEKKMMNYIYAIPHIPPTLFELKLHHADVKNDLIKLYETYLHEGNIDNNNNESISTLSQRLNSQIDHLFGYSIVVKNMQEYKMCQTGFVIGWKCNAPNRFKNKNHDFKNRTQIDDRF